MEEVELVEKKAKRDLLGSIQRRLNSGAYNKNKNLKRNLRTLRQKMQEFNKKGELKPFVRARYNATKRLMDRLEKFEEVGTAVPPPEPKKKFTIRRRLNNALNYSKMVEVPAAARVGNDAIEAAVAPRLMTLKKGRKKRAENVPYVPAGFNPPPANAQPLKVPRGEYNRSGEFHVKGYVEPSGEIGSAEDPNKYGYVFKEKSKKPKVLKITKLLTDEEMPYLERVHHKYLPLPELYNPFTGKKYAPENNPHPNINSAHEMLQQIMEKAKKSARNLKRREEKKAAAVEK
jgi:hypothetical protein